MKLTLQYATQVKDLPSEADFSTWAEAASAFTGATGELLIRVVDKKESCKLNNTYRDSNKATNVLSFPAEIPPQIAMDYLGDLVVCAPVVIQEAYQQNKLCRAHWAHMVIHGVLHLCGYDHQNELEANHMEMIEKKILRQFNFPDPYQIKHDE